MTTYGRASGPRHARPIRARRPVLDALVVLRDGAVFLFVIASFAVAIWLVTP